ncbi:hypothetical protein [Rhodopirellula sp. MGV]|uniref:hypothetical protein n=1 Tax=Rhodopirellula sp. MGV TaxID=2023130 RepID=UPI000B96A190|nr:hypothetical protein [Rhodopirellula sp. MGV]OYP37527.1 hypothetical protein CGZ80_05230 [Rhodopirellula sp. MGV]PNY37931.1 hypothetical protein C2E31_05370 [Rhodopirellula baltica]
MVGQFSQFCSSLCRRNVRAVVAGVVFATSFSLSNCQQTSAQDWYLPISRAARDSVAQLVPERIVAVEQSREAFLSAVAALRTHLTRSADAANGAAWLQYLAIDGAVEAIESDVSDRDIAESLDQIARRATGVYPGLEVAEVRRVRAAAKRFSDALRYRRHDVITNALGKQLERFSDQWDEIEATPSPDNIATLRLLLDLLERTNQTVDLVEHSRRLFSSPNIRVHVDESVVQQAVGRDVSQTTPVRDCILGTSIFGSATMNGDVVAELLPSDAAIRIRLALTGTVTTSNVGYNRGVRVRTTSDAQVYATRMLEVDAKGIRLGQVSTDASLHTNLNSIEHKLRLVRKIARKKAAEQKPLADRIAHRKLVRRISEEFALETDQAVASPDSGLLGEIQTWLYRLDMDKPQHRLASTADLITVTSLIRQGNQLGSPSAPPAVSSPSDITVQVHESLIDNTLGSFLAGRTLSKADLDRMIEQSGRPKSAESDAASDEPFEIDFDRSRPIIFEARDGKLVVGIRGTRFSQGSRELRRPLEIIATYQPAKTDTGEVVLERIDEVEINFPGTKRLSVAQTGIRSSIKQGFAEAFPQALLNQAIRIPEYAKLPAFAGAAYRVKAIEATDGWLTVGVGPASL